MIMRHILTLCVLVSLLSCTGTSYIDLSGEWTVRLDRNDTGEAGGWPGNLYETDISLPGTLDDAGLGDHDTLKPALEREQLLHLRRKVSYTGPAWYSREIRVPLSWKGKCITLELERVLWRSDVWVDGKKVDGNGESLVAPHRFDLTGYLHPGKKHLLTFRIDNREQYHISNGLAHSYTDHTQIIWNGIKGDIRLCASDMVRIDAVSVTPSADLKSVTVKAAVENRTGSPVEARLCYKASLKSGKALPVLEKDITLCPGVNEYSETYGMGESPELWSEFNPQVYEMKVSLHGKGSESEVSTDFGMRQIRQEAHRMTINGRPLFLRGTLECCIFPLTGTPPTDKEEWMELFRAASDYGLNHLRFHSWCPPEAAFEAADEMGFYLQVELPVWVLTIGKYEETVRFMYDESERIIREYGDHPSFAFLSLGNELQGDFSVLADMMTTLKDSDSRHLYTTTSFTFEKGHGAGPEPLDDYYVTQWTEKGWVRGQGVFNSEPPSFDKDFRNSIEGICKPLITHEIGQYAIYPDMREIEKYTGVLYPLNFISVRNDLQSKGLLDRSEAYLEASGKLAAILYKEEIERALKTDGISGFQLLDLHDFPGQGTALVGLLNAFWESKGIITGDEFRRFCSPAVPLVKFRKAVYENKETFHAVVDFANYTDSDIDNIVLKWDLVRKSDNHLLYSGETIPLSLEQGYNSSLAVIDCPLHVVGKASECELTVYAEGTDISNSWKIWVYPSKVGIHWGDVKFTRDYSEALALLGQGEKVLFNPDWRTIRGIEGKFVPVFWSPVHFPKQAATMGILCDPAHPALEQFPTASHTDWQWWDLNINSTTIIVDSLSGGAPVVEMIDNFANNRRLALLYEGKGGNGKLMMASFDITDNLDDRPVARQMLYSVLAYMNSDRFDPAELEGMDAISGIFSAKSGKK